ncbi:MAG: hypothetical protein Q7S44_02365 [bacterium]|nr:hypothetical protein [bacterium]
MKAQKFLVFVVGLAIAIVVSSFYLWPGSNILAQSCPTGTNAIQIDSGFLSVTNPNSATNFSLDPTFSCIINSEAQIPQFSILSYEELKSLYYDQSKVISSYKTEFTGSITESLTSFPLTGYPGNTINQYIEAEAWTDRINGAQGSQFSTQPGPPIHITPSKTASPGPRVGYSIYIPTLGDYQIYAYVNTTATTNNTFLVDFDTDPYTDITKAWDIPSTGGAFVEKIASWRGTTGSDTNPPIAQYSPKIWTNLSAGTHTLYIRGAEINAKLDKFKIVPVSGGSQPTPLQSNDPYRLFHISKNGVDPGNLTIDTKCLFLNNNDQPACSGDKTTNNGTVIIFVDGDLTINGNITYGGAVDASLNNTKTYGTIFIVKGNIYVATTVTELDAVFITAGPTSQFCDAASSSPCPTSVVSASALIINGAVIALNPSYPPQFMRTLGAINGTTPAETVKYQPKYLVNFKDILGRNLSIWNEVP